MAGILKIIWSGTLLPVFIDHFYRFNQFFEGIGFYKKALRGNTVSIYYHFLIDSRGEKQVGYASQTK